MRSQIAAPGGVRLDAYRIGQVTRGGRRILRDASLSVRPGEVVAVVGVSGSGKTTLLETLAGIRPTASGTLHYDGVDRAASDVVIGYVPQDDIIHRELPLRRTLRYAARLRLPAGTPDAELDARVNEVLGTLGLTDRADVAVGSLSGGQRKRASIAVELLTAPRILFLDEPTSGLDPAIAVELLAALRRLADSGATVVLTTHHVEDVRACDRVAVLARDGYLAFAGTPDEACRYFEVSNLAEVYVRLDTGGEPESWHERFESVRPPLEPLPDPGTSRPPEGARTEARRLGGPGQWGVLSLRSLDILRRNPLTLAILVGSPVAVLAMFLMLFQAHAFDPVRPSPGATVMIVFWIAFGGFFFGISYGLLQICSEFAILRRERIAGLRVGAYVLSKVAVLLPLLAIVDIALLGVLRALDRLPALGTRAFAQLFVTLLLCSACALTLGLLCSAAVANAAQATLMLPMLCFPQVLFVGAIVPVPVMAALGRWMSYAMSNRWAFEGLGHTAGLPQLWSTGASPLGPPLLATYGDSFDRAIAADWLILAGFAVLFGAATWAVLIRKGRRGAA